ncbi:class I SAM-dependent methyltransferase [Paenibacillus sp. P25]|nr:class I SAM-dependent methyltransferase [Paenibacillus sp. P25]
MVVETMPYFGLFKQLRELNLPNTADYDLYQGYYAQFYEAVTVRTDYDIPIYLEQAKQTGGPVLDLACGSGRVLMHLANAGYPVTGVDLSADMLQLCRRKLQQLPPRIKENVSLVQSDMTEFELGGTFGLIVLSATSITLLDDLGKVERLFRTVHRHLSLGGRFVFDLSNPQEHAHQTLRDGKASTFLR